MAVRKRVVVSNSRSVNFRISENTKWAVQQWAAFFVARFSGYVQLAMLVRKRAVPDAICPPAAIVTTL